MDNHLYFSVIVATIHKAEVLFVFAKSFMNVLTLTAKTFVDVAEKKIQQLHF